MATNSSVPAVCGKHREEVCWHKGLRVSLYDKAHLATGPVTWPPRPAVMNRPYFTTKQMNLAP